MTTRTARRLLIVGWDAADWQVIDPLLAKGQLPVLASLIERGVRSDLTTLEPKLSPLLWTSIATGRTPDLHGITNFVEPKPDGSGLRVASSTSRRVKALWNIAHQAGMRVQVTGWYASHPAEPVRGSVTSNLLMEGDPGTAGAWPLADGAVHPDSLADAVATARVGRAAFRDEGLQSLLPGLPASLVNDERVASLCKLMAVAASVERAATAAMHAGPWDLSMVFFESIDTVGHQFMQYRAPRMKHVAESDLRAFGGVMDAVYRWHDAALGRLLAQAGPETTVLLLSDHGFHSGAGRPYLDDLPPERRMEKESSWHRPTGVLVASGPGIKRGAMVAAANILDLAPTALSLLGLPAADDFAGRAIVEMLDEPVPDRIRSWEEVEGEAGLHPADARQDPYEAADAIQQLVDLGYMAALPEDAKGQVELVRRESAFNLGAHLLSRGKVRSALPHFETLVAQRPRELRYRMCLASCLVGAGEWGRGIDVLRETLQQESGHAEARLMLARALLDAGDRDASLREADAAMRVARAQPALLPVLADLLVRQGRGKEAASFYRKAVDADRTAIQPRLGLARALLAELPSDATARSAQLEHAAQAALDAMERSKAVPEGHMILGAALAWYGDLEQAARSLDLALTFDPRHLGALRLRAVLAAHAGAHDEVCALMGRAYGAQGMIELAEPAPLPFEWQALAAHLGVDQALLR
jgi:predicted AlkP superfamily phosphohydrolase/phosphomutase/tetratricopeptide (TPR) repeat protein